MTHHLPHLLAHSNHAVHALRTCFAIIRGVGRVCQ